MEIEIVRKYSDDPTDWEAVAKFLIEFILALRAKKEKAPGIPGAAQSLR